MRKIILLLCLLPISVFAEQQNQKGFDKEFDSEKTWTELLAQLPAFPKQENLLMFDAGPASKNLHYIDAPSIKVEEDGVVLYSLVIKSPGGAMNISYEGMRCASQEAKGEILIFKFSNTVRRLYALGRDDKTWVRARVSKWEELENIPQHYAQRALARYFFCPTHIIVKNEEEAIQALKRGSHPRVIQ